MADFFKKESKPVKTGKIKKKYLRKLQKAIKKFEETDRKVSDALASVVNRFDEKSDVLAGKLHIRHVHRRKQFNLAREWAELNKKRLLVRFACAVAVLLCIAGAVNLCTAYEYAYNGRKLGVVTDQEDVLRVTDLVSNSLSKQYGAEIAIDKEEDISFKKVFRFGKEIDDMEVVLSKMTYMQDMIASGIGIYIDGNRVAIVDNEETANSILDSVLAAFTVQSDNTVYEEVGFAEDVKLEQVTTRLGRLENPGDVVQRILTGAEEIKTHTVQSGETLSGISNMYNISMEDLLATNPLVSPARLSIGQEIVLTQPAPMLTVQTVEVSTLTEIMPYQTLYEDNASIYQGETSVKVSGINGEREVVAKIVKNNGIEIARLELQSTILSSPTNEVLYVGTKELPPKQGTGTFISPVTGYTLTSRFGSRWGSTHLGIDMAIASGTKIRAADGGTVTFAGYQSSYGYIVKIDHGGGYETYYAHCSKLHVSAGERVYQGQHIANVGSTGYSTGPHLHFEVRYLGTPKNPLNYI